MRDLIVFSMFLAILIFFGLFIFLPVILTFTVLFFKFLIWLILFIFILGLVTLFKFFFKKE